MKINNMLSAKNSGFKKFDKNKKQKRIVIGSVIGILLIVGTIILYRTYAFYETKKEFNVIRGQVPEFSHEDVQLSWYIGDVKQTDPFPAKNGEYSGVSVSCENGVTAEWSNAIWGLVNVNTNGKKKISCSVTFESGNNIADNDLKPENIACGKTIFGVTGSNNCKYLYNEIANNTLGTDTSQGISYSAISSDTNGKGIYTLASTASNTYPIYFYRGEVNNNVIFNNICWKIVRTTETGGVKLIYNGLQTDGKCNNTGKATQITDVVGMLINDAHGPEYVGWKYTEGEYHGTTEESFTYSLTKRWYDANMLSVEDKLESTIWCNDRRAYSSKSAIPGITDEMAYNASSVTYYAPGIRAEILKSPSLECPNSNDQFPGYFGLITSDEVMYAGGVWETSNTSYYLYTGRGYWTMSPNYGESDWGTAIEVNLGSTHIETERDVRPMVSLNSSAIVSSGNGSSDTPYIVN